MTNHQISIIVVLGVLLVMAYRLYSRPSRAPSPSQLDPNLFMPDFAAKAVVSASKVGVTLDYSPDSIENVEEVLSQLHDQRVKGELGDRELNYSALHYGGYIGEVIRRKYGGSWATDHHVVGPATFPISWNGQDSFPVGWCGKRILNGDEDNVWFKFQVVTTDQGKAGVVAYLSTARPSADE